MEDFTVSLGCHSKINVTHFKNEVSNLKQKFDNIFNGTPFAYEAIQKFWNYIFAVKIIPIRNTYFIDWNKSAFEHRLSTDPDFARRYNMWKMHQEMDELLDREYEDFWQERINHFEEMLKHAMHQTNAELIRAREVLGIGSDETLTKEFVASQFRICAKSVHPDFHPDQEERANSSFHALYSARDLLLKSLQRDNITL